MCVLTAVRTPDSLKEKETGVEKQSRLHSIVTKWEASASPLNKVNFNTHINTYCLGKRYLKVVEYLSEIVVVHDM